MDSVDYYRNFLKRNFVRIQEEKQEALDVLRSDALSYEALEDTAAFYMAIARLYIGKMELMNRLNAAFEVLNSESVDNIEKQLNFLRSFVENYPKDDRFSVGSPAPMAALLAAVDLGKSIPARKNAALAHKENHAFRADAFQWLDKNFVQGVSLDKHAEMLLRVVPVSFRTTRKWVGEWRKLRAASQA